MVLAQTIIKVRTLQIEWLQNSRSILLVAFIHVSDYANIAATLTLASTDVFLIKM